MAYDATLEALIVDLLRGEPGLARKKMFGGVAWLFEGNLAFGVNKDALIVRLDPAGAERLLGEPHVRPFDLTGRPMKGWIMVAPEGWRDPDRLRDLLDRGLAWARALPPKKGKH